MKNLKKLLAVIMCVVMLVPTVAFAKTSPSKVDFSNTAKVTSTAITYTGKAQDAKIVVKVNGKTLVAGTDYVITGQTKPTDAGTYKVTIKGMGKYSGTKTYTYKVASKKVAPKATAASKFVSGKNQRILPTVKVGNKVLKYGKDYTVTGNVKKSVGKYTMVIKGKGNYSFTKKVTYRIQYNAAKVSAKAASKTYTGKAQTTAITVKNGKTVLKKGVDYKISGTVKATKAGKYTVKITGIGNYKGTKTITYTINKAAQKNVKATVNSAKKIVKVTGVKGNAKVSYTTNNSKVSVVNGKIVVKKGVKKGTKVRITVKVASSTNYKATSKPVIYTVK